ncbi:MAG: hypothetical protein A4E60_01676 [Syntrophorhabdus sp. PtaB.Bin047]|nr:MAG: hypothetical protein A4E60_01676 [Syntrophorhabdus sp. PtaB.Bin047]
MLGETTLAMLYVPLFFYIFDRWAEKSGKKEFVPEKGSSGAQKEQAPPDGATPEKEEG